MANTRVTTPVTDFDKATSLPGLKIPSGDNSNQPAGAAAEQGMIRNDTEETVDSSDSAIAHYNGTNWQYFAATESADPDPAFSVRYLVVAGGGGGGVIGGGGGAGGFRTSFGTGNINGGLTAVEASQNLTANTNYTLTVGAGGIATTTPGNSGPGGTSGSGGNSSFVATTTVLSVGGGGGGSYSAGVGGSGGSGGGGSSSPNSYAGGLRATTPVQGFNGANANGSSPYPAGGGGGAARAGGASTSAGSTSGGTALASSITGTPVLYAGGGGGGYQSYYGGSVNTSGGGGGASDGQGSNNALNATANTGSGGGGGGFGTNLYYGQGGNGGSGVVILRYPVGNSINIVSGTSPIAADLNAAVAGSTTEKFTRFTATGAVTFTIS